MYNNDHVPQIKHFEIKAHFIYGAVCVTSHADPDHLRYYFIPCTNWHSSAAL